MAQEHRGRRRLYRRLGLLCEAPRAPNGYRQYDAATIVRLQRIRRLQALGLSLAQIKLVLGAPDHAHSLREVLTGLLGALDAQLTALTERRDRVAHLLATSPLAALDQPPAPSPTMQLLRDRLGAQAKHPGAEVLALDTALVAQLDLVLGEDPEYQRQMRELAELLAKLAQSAIAAHPDAYQELVTLGEQFVALAAVPEDSPEVECLAQAWQRLPQHNVLAAAMQAMRVPAGANAALAHDLTAATLPAHCSPAQRRFLSVLAEAQHPPDAQHT